MKKIIFMAAVLLTASLTISADPIADIANAKCVKCHSASAQFARIEGQRAEYNYKSMLEYKTKVRGFEMMYKKMVLFDEATLKGLAEYFSKLTPAPGIKGDAALMAKGKDLYERIIPGTGLRACAECHGKNAEGGGFGSGLNPRLAGQYSDFTISQMAFYKAGSSPQEVEMTQAAQKLTDDQVKAIAEYVQSL